ncbi:protein translocase SEC61 complex subunit gamma [Candidatus Pacearchaeota archaeon]|nr:protein translocase SEC61 complex subunit gamma [Candidatus Pacearchaeota archaeon]
MGAGEKIKSFIAQCGRVWHLLRKPSSAELKGVSKISAIGLGLIGLLGFAISVIMTFVYPK